MTIKFHKVLILIIIVLYSCSKQLPNQVNFEISENWSFREVGDSNWLNATVPGYVHTDLIDNGIIDDPYYRLNEHDVQWVDKKDWEYRTSFKVSEHILKYDVVELNFNGLDTYADVYLNDKLILNADNMFIGWTVNCKQHLKIGSNSLRIVLKSPIKIGLEKREQLGYYLPGAENDQSELGGLGDKKVTVFTRKPGYHFGWDWGPRLVSSGIWQGIELSAWNKTSIRDVNVIQEEVTENVARLSSEIEIESVKETKVDILCFVDSEPVYEDKVSLKKGVNSVYIPFKIINPELWWTNGLGNQKLYEVEVQIKNGDEIISSNTQNIGLRTIEIVQKADSVGKSFYFKLNGHPVFMKGANYIPQDIFLSRVSNNDYENIIKSAVDANYNMLRVWGGGIYEKDIFYDLCDKHGILVWQDFMFACAMYPGDNSFLDNVKKEAIYNVKRLRNHACIALWCGDNEILSAWNRWGWKENVLKNQGQDIVDTVWKAYDDIFHHILPEVVAELDPQKLYWSSSPSSGFGELENGKSGDNHYWGVWWAKEPFSKYEQEIPRFMSEFGFQSFPDINSVKKYSLEEDWDINSEVMNSHQRSSIGNVTIEEYLLRDYIKPKDFEMFLYVGQLLQARGIKMGIEAHRRNMPYCMGSLYWQINDCWPVASWSGIDYYGNWKALHYAVADAFKNVKISFEAKNSNLDIYVISDSLINFWANLKLSVMDFQGAIIYESEENIVIEGNSSHVYLKEDIEAITEGYGKNELLINAVLTDANGKIFDRSIYYFISPKNLVLPSPNVGIEIERIEDNKFALRLTTDILAKNVYLLSPVEGHFSENYFDLLPNEKKEILFITDEKITVGKLKNEITILTLIDSYDL